MSSITANTCFQNKSTELNILVCEKNENDLITVHGALLTTKAFILQADVETDAPIYSKQPATCMTSTTEEQPPLKKYSKWQEELTDWF